MKKYAITIMLLISTALFGCTTTPNQMEDHSTLPASTDVDITVCKLLIKANENLISAVEAKLEEIKANLESKLADKQTNQNEIDELAKSSVLMMIQIDVLKEQKQKNEAVLDELMDKK